MFANSEFLPWSRYEAARERFTGFARHSPNARLWETLLARAGKTFGLEANRVVSPTWRFLRDRPTVERLFNSASGGFQLQVQGNHLRISQVQPADELVAYVAECPDEEQQALEVLFRRALDPLDALATWPAECFFSEQELQLLGRMSRSDTPPDAPAFGWMPGQDINYGGYVCVIAKLTRLCNLRCVYCHDWAEGPNQTMRFEVLAHLFQRTFTPAEHAVVDLVWHGGEPTLLRPVGILRVLALQRWFRRPGQRIKNILQTNATTLNQDWVELFHHYRFQISVSLDGPASVHDRTRPQVGGRSSFPAVQRGLRLLRGAGLLKGVLMVVTPALVELGPQGLVDFLQAEEVSEVGLLPMRPDNVSPPSPGTYLDQATYVRFLLGVREVLRQSPSRALRVRELEAANRALAGQQSGFCELSGNCVGHFFLAELDGSIAHCDKYIGDPAYTLGNVLQHDFSEIRSNPKTRALWAENQRATALMNTCPHFRYCRGWCPHERYVSQRHEPHASTSCCGLAPLFDALSNPSP
ncbi:uncharacterized protein ATI61_11885 [Archangium gephyra]|uniref:Transcriptional regulator n=1 Tax=Archangium gephyra TaxID=48 RepID=A0AAC8Q9W1_9BACT|nr:radical SAM protein [Archangium gephyra]AKJ03246.1 Transcriptional regulator [Archangium gephyra]REG22880.1 uncharacterized protein ATI61_11885 [Archangium gephyra]